MPDKVLYKVREIIDIENFGVDKIFIDRDDKLANAII